MNKRHENARRHVRRHTQLFIENAVTDNIVLIQALGLAPIIAAGDTRFSEKQKRAILV